MATEHWFRWHHGTVNDPKWKVIAARAGHAMSRNVTVCHVVSVWAAMLECASQSSPRGSLAGWVDEDVAAGLEMEELEVRAIREAMVGKTIAGEELTAWKARQPLREDTSAADRKRAERERKSHDESRNVTQCHEASRNVPLEERRGEESREKQERGASPIGSRLPATWALPAEWRVWAKTERPELDVQAEADKFADFWHGKAGKDARKTDWQATWRNWIRRADAPKRGRAAGGDVFAGAL